LKKRDRFNGSSAQCIAERSLELQLDEGDLNRAVRDVWMNVLHAVNRARSARRFRTGYEVSMK
jgi:hypothetical protein